MAQSWIFARCGKGKWAAAVFSDASMITSLTMLFNLIMSGVFVFTASVVAAILSCCTSKPRKINPPPATLRPIHEPAPTSSHQLRRRHLAAGDTYDPSAQHPFDHRRTSYTRDVQRLRILYPFATVEAHNSHGTCSVFTIAESCAVINLDVDRDEKLYGVWPASSRERTDITWTDSWDVFIALIKQFTVDNSTEENTN